MIFSKAYGKANLTYNVDFKLNTPTNIGSVSKQFTAFAILLLEQQGILSLEDDVRKHIPELPKFEQKITLRNLLNHTNGLREFFDVMRLSGSAATDKLLRSEVINILKRQQTLQNKPGEETNYNNSAFILLAEIIERKTGSKFPYWMKKNIFEPLEMNDSYVRYGPNQIIPNASQGYKHADNGIYIEANDLYAAYGAGGIYTTPADLLKWLTNFNDPKLGSKKLIEKLVTPGVLNNGDMIPYGLGIVVDERKGLKMYAHTGADNGHIANVIYYPEINSGVITLSNSASFSESIGNEISDVFFTKYLKAENDTEDTNRIPKTIEMDEKLLENYTGRYKSSSIGLIINYKINNGQLTAYTAGESPIGLHPISNTTFTYDDDIAMTITFKLDNDGKSISAIHNQEGMDYKLEKLTPFNKKNVKLKNYEGKYFSEELETFYTIILKNKVLYATHRNLDNIELTIVEPDTFSGNVFFMSNIQFKRNKKDEINGFSVSTGRTKGVQFKKQ